MRIQSLILTGALICGAATLMPVAVAESVEMHRFDIKPQELASALLEFSRQADRQVVGATEALREVRTGGVTGELSIGDALGRLLQGTGLQYELVGEHSIRIISDASRAVNEEMPAGTEIVRLARGEGALGIDSATAAWQDAGENSNTADSRAGAGSGKLEEIVVTAQKREENLQEVPISISVLGGEELDRSNVKGVSEALRYVPGVSVSEFEQGGGVILGIRGVTAAGAAFADASPIAYYVDSVPFGFARYAFAPDPGAFDLDRVEILRGPQGTLYGAGGVGGVIRVLTNDPNLNEFDFKGQATISKTHWAEDLNYRGDTAINLPIVEGKVAARATIGYTDLAGWVDAPYGDDVNDAKISNIRVKLRAKPVENLDIILTGWHATNSFDQPNFSDPDGKVSLATRDQPAKTNFDVYSADVTYDFGAVAVSSKTSYIDYKNPSELDFSSFLPPGQTFILRTDYRSKVFSEELLLSSTAAGPWSWTAGAFYRDAKDSALSYYNDVLAVVGLDKTKSYAAFGEISHSFLEDKLKATFGLRYFHSEFVTEGLAEPTRLEDSSSALTPRVVLAWEPSKSLNLYASYSEGFRAGAPQPNYVLSVAPQFPAAEPDKLRNYEVGAKGDFLGGLGSFEAALYYIDWKNIQQVVTVDFTEFTGVPAAGPALVNAASASGLGADLALLIRPTTGLTLGANLSWNDLELDNDVITSDDVVLFRKGERISRSPEWTVGGSASYHFPLGSTGFRGLFTADINYVSKIIKTSGLGTKAASDSLVTAKTSFTLEAPKNWSLMVFVDNLTNEYGTPSPSDFNPEWASRIRPRTYGLQIGYRY